MKGSLRGSAPTLNQQQELSIVHLLLSQESWLLAKEIREIKQMNCDLKISKAGSCVDTSIQRPGNLAVHTLKWMCKYAKGKKCVRITRSHNQPQEVLGDSAVGCEVPYQSQATGVVIRQPTDNSCHWKWVCRKGKEATRREQVSAPGLHR